ncbi:MAG: hypothetical protein IJV99_04215 [Clostridia bacterium]|nr:hypothetical protein [Clostridia bacterium]
MEDKVIRFERNAKTYVGLAEERIDRGDLVGALGFLFSAKEVEPTYEVFMTIADVYAEMGLLEQSNKFWFYYLDKAPKDKLSVAYEELGINYFYLEDYASSSYYFHLKLTTDGFVSKENIDPEIIEFFSGEEFRKNSYRIVYPYDKADFSYDAKRAKRALAGGAFETAIEIYNKIPVECRTEEMASDLAISYLMNEQPDMAAEVARDSIARHGENVSAYCNLSNVYEMKEDQEKSKYYYQTALSMRKGEENEVYKIVPCAIEQADHQTAKECILQILKDRPYDVSMRFFLGIAHLNLGENEKAYDAFSQALRIVPNDGIYRYYANYALNLKDGLYSNGFGDRLRYLHLLPETQEKMMQEKINELAKNLQKVGSALKKKQVREMLELALRYPDEVSRQAVYVLVCANTPVSIGLLKDALMDTEVNLVTKKYIIYTLVLNGVKDKFSVVGMNVFFTCKPKTLAFEKVNDNQSNLYLSAYAWALSVVSFLGVEGIDKLAKTTNKVYAKLKGVVTDSEATNEELAGLIVHLSGIKNFETYEILNKFFHIERKRFELLLKLYKEKNND